MPINDVLAHIGAGGRSAAVVRRRMLRGMSNQHEAYWGWSEGQWGEVISAAAQARHHVVAIGYLLGGLIELHHTGKCFFQTRLAARIFGVKMIEEAVVKVRDALTRLGYCRLAVRDSQEVVCEAILVNRSPFLQDLNIEVLERIRHSNAAEAVKGHVVMLSRALVSLGILTQPIEPTSPFTATLIARGEIGVSAEWLAWCRRWKETVVARPSTRKSGYHVLLKVGRWLGSAHPEIVSPEQWTRELCVEYVAALSRMKIGEHLGNGGFLVTRQLVGKPLKAATIDGNLGKLRKFFRRGLMKRPAMWSTISSLIEAGASATAILTKASSRRCAGRRACHYPMCEAVSPATGRARPLLPNYTTLRNRSRCLNSSSGSDIARSPRPSITRRFLRQSWRNRTPTRVTLNETSAPLRC
jgi:hypothetical protein